MLFFFTLGFVWKTHQNVRTVRTEHGEEEGTGHTEHEATIFERTRHRQDADAEG